MQTRVVDVNGVAINVNDTVKLQGTVIAVTPSSNHYMEVTIRLSNPVVGINGVPNPEVAGLAPAIHSIRAHSPGVDQIIKCSGLTLNH